MKRALLSLLFAASASLASEPKYGIILQGFLPVVDAPSPFESSLGAGAMGALEARFDLDERIAIAPFAGFEYTYHAIEASDDEATAELSIKSMFLPLGASLQLALTPALRLAITPEIDISLSGSGKTSSTYDGETHESDEQTVKNDKSPFLIGFGFAYGETETGALLLGYKFAVSEYVKNYKISKFYIGGRFAM